MLSEAEGSAVVLEDGMDSDSSANLVMIGSTLGAGETGKVVGEVVGVLAGELLKCENDGGVVAASELRGFPNGELVEGEFDMNVAVL